MFVDSKKKHETVLGTVLQLTVENYHTHSIFPFTPDVL